MTDEFRTRLQRIVVERRAKEEAEQASEHAFVTGWCEAKEIVKSVMEQTVEEIPGSKVQERGDEMILAIDAPTKGSSLVYKPNARKRRVLLVWLAEGTACLREIIPVEGVSCVERVQRQIVDFLEGASIKQLPSGKCLSKFRPCATLGLSDSC